MFHWRDGWFFSRLGDGTVQIVKHEDAKDSSPVVAYAEIPRDEWASIVASVSKSGDIAPVWNLARWLHDYKVGEMANRLLRDPEVNKFIESLFNVE